MKILKKLRADQTGIAAVELGLLLGLITLAVVGGVANLGDGVSDSYNNTAQKIADAT